MREGPTEGGDDPSQCDAVTLVCSSDMQGSCRPTLMDQARPGEDSFDSTLPPGMPSYYANMFGFRGISTVYYEVVGSSTGTLVFIDVCTKYQMQISVGQASADLEVVYKVLVQRISPLLRPAASPPPWAPRQLLSPAAGSSFVPLVCTCTHYFPVLVAVGYSVPSTTKIRPARIRSDPPNLS